MVRSPIKPAERWRYAVFLALGLGSVAGLLTAAGCSKSRGATTTEGPDGNRTNVLLLTLCTMRADHLGCYGYERPTSPNIDAMAAEGVRFDYTLTQAPWTRASVAAMVTGLFPRTLNIAEPDRRDEPRLLHDSFTTLAERMKEAGYFTIGVTANAMLNSEFGFKQGFDFWHDTGSGWKHAKRKGLLRMEDLSDLLFEGIEQAGGKRFFAHLVNVDVHDPRKEPYPLESPPPFGASEPKSAHDRYDLRIRYLDEQFGKLRKRLAEAGLTDTLIIVNGDHGEGLGGYHSDDHGHGGRLYNSTVWVPWIMHHPGLKPASPSFTDLAQNIDLVPTVLDLLGISYDGSRVDGVSRSASIVSGHTPALDFSVIETEFKHSHKSAILTEEWKFVIDRNPCVELKQTLDPPIYELYRYREDREERNNLFSARPEMARELEQKLIAWQREHTARVSNSQVLATAVRPETIDAIKSIGYVGEDEDSEDGDDEWPSDETSPCWLRTVNSEKGIDVPPPAGPPTVVLMTVSGLRASHLGSMGYPRITTPNIDQLAAQSVVWDRCMAADLSSPAAHRVLMTGSVTTGIPGKSSDRQTGVPVDGALTLAEFARQSGIRTAAFVSASEFAAKDQPLLALGFEKYDLPKKKRRRADKVVQRALQWVREAKQDPVLLWINYADLLRETPMDPCLARMLPPDESLKSWAAKHWTVPGSGQLSDALLRRAAAYDQNLRFIDLQIGELLNSLCAMGRLENSIVVLVGDQGRVASVEGDLAPTPTWEDCRVPFILRGSGDFAVAPKRMSNWVSTADVAATLVGRLNLSLAAAEAVGRDGIDQLGNQAGRASAYSQACLEKPAEPKAATSCDLVIGSDDWLWFRSKDGTEQLRKLENGAPGLDAKERHADVVTQFHELAKQIPQQPITSPQSGG